jgi:hypothetical protein
VLAFIQSVQQAAAEMVESPLPAQSAEPSRA